MNAPTPKLPWVRPRVLWHSGPLDTAQLTPPTMLCATASPHEVGEWRHFNRWADAVPCVTFFGDQVGGYAAPDAVAFGPPDPSHAPTPYRVDNAPKALLDTRALHRSADTPYSETERDALGRYLSAVEAVAAFAPRGPTWWILADSDGGLGAVQLAWSRGGACVALASAGVGIGPGGAALANKLSVDVKVTNLRAGPIA